MAEDVGILISQPGVAVKDATGAQVTFNSRLPFIKLDTQNAKAFQTILLLITTDPPEPVSPVVETWTTVHSFAHGYKYIPSLESLFYVSTAPPGSLFTQDYFQDTGRLATQSAANFAEIYAIADATNVYIIVHKLNYTINPGNLLTGATLQITVHVFVEDIGV